MKVFPDVEGLKGKFEKMEEEGEIDESIIKELEDLENEIYEKNLEDYIMDQGKMNRYKTFFALKTQLDILDSVKNRIKEKKEDDNPVVAKDTITILDHISKIDDFTFSNILKLQRKAIKVNLFPDEDEIKKNMSFDKIEEGNKLFENLKKRISNSE